ncbi:N,N-dimethylformamidase beta subunit family domain-containing protein [Vulgatibacter sp.]|uniref:N,N-dimethylformamidase beta subunit family domain-containing protein n=1 Tax=Vulgatibacter sp. TaxID=1971226 RepID=UPI003569C5C2
MRPQLPALVLALLAACSDPKLVDSPPLQQAPSDPPLVRPEVRPPAPPALPAVDPPRGSPVRHNPIPEENALPGDPTWDDTYDAWNRQIEGYASRATAEAGDVVEVKLHASAARTASWRLYRFGWYGGDGARLVAEGGPVEVEPQPPCPPDATTGLVRCDWETAFSFTVQQAWVSGLYAIRMERDDGYTRFIPLVITDDRRADLLFQAAVTTYQAYNTWGGTSLYADATGTLPLGRATHVGFDRPYDGDQGTGQLLRYEVHMARFLERHGYDVTYATNLDLHARGPSLLGRRGAYLSVGHDEYWSGEMRDAVEIARDRGTDLLFFSANTAYWKVRFEEFAAPNNPRVMVCYKGRSGDDPVQHDVTARFRDPEVDRPENGLLGVMYESWSLLSAPFVVGDADAFLFEGTGLRDGDVLQRLVGYEYDRTFDNGATPQGFTVLARSPTLDAEGKPGLSETGWYEAPSGALVFSSGTIEWAHGLGKPGLADPRVERMTANVIERALGIPVPRGVGEGPLPEEADPEGPFAAAVRTVVTGLEAPSSVVELPDGSLAVAEPRQHRILHVGPAPQRRVSVLAGDGQLSNNPAYDGVPGAQARFFSPTAVIADENGDVIVADTYNHCIRKILNDPQRTVITVAGSMGQRGSADGAGDEARFFLPMGLAIDPLTSDILVADAGNHRIRAIERGSWQVRTVAGTVGGDVDGPALTARFSYPTAVAAREDGTIYAVASGNAKLVSVARGVDRQVTTLAGGRVGWLDGPGTVALLAPQAGLLWDGEALLLSEPTNYRIRRVVPGASAATTEVGTFAGSGRSGLVDGAAFDASLPLPLGLALGADGTIYVADGANGAIRAIEPQEAMP